MKRGDSINNKRLLRINKFIRECWNEISFKDKSLILIMIILIIQCIHNLYNVDPTNTNYISINVVIRTSVAAIFGYFLSSNFLAENKARIDEETRKEKLEIIEQVMENKKIRKELQSEYDNVTNSEDYKEKEDVIKEEEEKYVCNRYLQNLVAVSICIILVLSLIIGVNFKLINDGSVATISQFRDLVSGSIGFLIGNSSNKGEAKKK